MLASVALATGFVVTPVRLRRLAIVLVLSGTVVGLGGTASYAVATAATPHTGSIPTVGPSGAAAGSATGGGFGGFGGTRGTTGGTTDGTRQAFPGGTGTAPGGDATAPATTGGSGGGFGGEGASTNTELVQLLQDAGTRWAAAVSGSQSAASYELASSTAVMAMGGWSDDPTPTLAQFQQYVADGEVHYLVSGGGLGGGRGGDSDATKIQEWVAANYTELTVGGTTVHDLTQPLSSGTTATS